jgi:hypothetical protein
VAGFAITVAKLFSMIPGIEQWTLLDWLPTAAIWPSLMLPSCTSFDGYHQMEFL